MLGLTQKEVVARLRRLGVATTNKALSSLEHGAGLDVGKLPELARALDCTLTYLVGLTDDPARWEPDSSDVAAGQADALRRGDAAGPGMRTPEASRCLHRARRSWARSTRRDVAEPHIRRISR